MRKTELMRVPREFKGTIKRIAKKRGSSMTDLLKTDGVRIFNRADELTDFLGFKRKRQK